MSVRLALGEIFFVRGLGLCDEFSALQGYVRLPASSLVRIYFRQADIGGAIAWLALG